MTETRMIIDAYRRARAEHVRAALATVVRVQGSAYRRPGARMIITDSGRTTGVISGGCLEADVRERAHGVMQSGRPVLVTYDTSRDDDLVWGLGSGCNGIVRVLIEPAGDRTDDLVRFLDTSSTAQRAALATIVRSAHADLPLGSRVFLPPTGVAQFDPAAPAHRIAHDVVADLRGAIRDGVSSLRHYGPDRDVEAFIEVVEPQVPLVIFGGGPDVVPLVTMAAHLGWHTTVVDTHRRERSMERFSAADAVILCPPEEVSARVPLANAPAVLLMTHNYLHDLELLKAVRESPARYIGLLGPRRRTERLLAALPDRCVPRRTRLHGPAGLDIGAETPFEIALSILTEILSVLRKRSGGALRLRDGSIHGSADLDLGGGLAAAGVCSSTAQVLCEAVGA
jgi:xanthine dehydrogenase accessory factor